MEPNWTLDSRLEHVNSRSISGQFPVIAGGNRKQKTSWEAGA